ncbi:MAG: N-acetyl-gamma-glutamyl-phosphate reductase [Deltaproteobacteria bacterium]|nr:N-acetyl-gamma-glutamyl-phosphate reductase [Deltaproteobacteria bacterium]
MAKRPAGKKGSAAAGRLRVAICGASGYTGLELLRLLAGHPGVEVVYASSEKSAGQPVAELFPSLKGPYDGLKLERLDPARAAKSADIVFTALPHAEAAPTVIEVLKLGKKVIDLSADFRLKDAAVYGKTYGQHPAPQFLREAVYGLPEIYRDRIKKARLIANPGCYPQGPILSLAPLLRAGLTGTGDIVIDSKSGVSGAGRGASVDNLFTEVSGSFKAYKVLTHRHTPEIEQELSVAAGKNIHVTFTPHLVPMNRGILSTIYAKAPAGTTWKQVTGLWRKAYAGEPFIRICPEGAFPATRDVNGTNYADLSCAVAPDGRVVIVTAIDNLCKGASGSAVQCMNLLAGFPETTALTALALVP